MTEILVHELIELQGDTLVHHFFDSEEDARAYRSDLQYLHRAWGMPALTRCRIQDHRT